MKLLKRLAVSLLCLCMLLCVVSCGNNKDDTPDGMKNATAAGADYRFYIPAYWNVSNEYGVSGGYYTQAGQSRASVVKYTLSEAQLAAKAEAIANGQNAIAWFWETECLSALTAVAKGGLEHVKEQDADILLGSMNAKRYYCKVRYNGTVDLTHTVQAVGDAGNAFYVVTCTLTDALYADRAADIDLMIQHFKLADPYIPDDYAKATAKDQTAPEGMKLVSSDEVAYRFYAPLNWTVDRNEAIYAAYLESDRSSVSVVPHQPVAGQMSIEGYFALCEQQMLETAGNGGYVLLSTEQNATLGGRAAHVYDYTYTVGNETFRYRQVIAAYGGMIYSMTYTSRLETFESHIDDVNAMIANFTFR